MTSLTLPERTLIHLYRYRHILPAENYTAQREMTQDGIADALGISRSHSSIIANRLEERGKLFSERVRITGAVGPRKVYYMTPDGIRDCEKIIARDSSVSTAPIYPNNLNYCNSAAFWSLDPSDITLLGCLMVLRIPVSKKELGDSPPGLIPFDSRGKVNIRPETRLWYTEKADTETLRRWHSAAADWCLDRRCDPKEKLYHLFRANRKREAVKLAHSWQYMFMDFPDREVRDMMEALASEFDNTDLHRVATRMSLRMGEVTEARREVEALDLEGSTSTEALMSEVLLAEGKPSAALDMALDCYIGDIDTSAALGLCMNANERYGEALTYLDRCGKEMRRTGCVFRMDEILTAKSRALRAMGNTADADATMDMAGWWKKDPAMRYRGAEPLILKGSCWT